MNPPPFPAFGKLNPWRLPPSRRLPDFSAGPDMKVILVPRLGGHKSSRVSGKTMATALRPPLYLFGKVRKLWPRQPITAYTAQLIEGGTTGITDLSTGQDMSCGGSKTITALTGPKPSSATNICRTMVRAPAPFLSNGYSALTELRPGWIRN